MGVTIALFAALAQAVAEDVVACLGHETSYGEDSKGALKRGMPKINCPKSSYLQNRSKKQALAVLQPSDFQANKRGTM